MEQWGIEDECVFSSHPHKSLVCLFVLQSNPILSAKKKALPGLVSKGYRHKSESTADLKEATSQVDCSLCRAGCCWERAGVLCPFVDSMCSCANPLQCQQQKKEKAVSLALEACMSGQDFDSLSPSCCKVR